MTHGYTLNLHNIMHQIYFSKKESAHEKQSKHKKNGRFCFCFLLHSFYVPIGCYFDSTWSLFEQRMFLQFSQFILMLTLFLRLCITSCYCEGRILGLTIMALKLDTCHEPKATAVKVAAKAMTPWWHLEFLFKALMEKQERVGDRRR